MSFLEDGCCPGGPQRTMQLLDTRSTNAARALCTVLLITCHYSILHDHLSSESFIFRARLPPGPVGISL